MGLEEMEAYARQALLIDKLERKNEALHNELAASKAGTLQKDEVRKWLEIGESYLFINDAYKDSIRIIFGDA